MKYTVFIFFIIIFYVLGQILVDKKGKEFYIEDNKNSKVYDIVWENLPDIYNYKEIVDIFLLCIFFFILFTKSVNFKDFSILFGVIVFIRTLTLQTLILPRYPYCYRTTLQEIIIKGCYDKLFSGHFSFVYLLTLLSNFSFQNSILINGLNSFLITTTRRHYTVDIILSFFITNFIFTNKKSILEFII